MASRLARKVRRTGKTAVQFRFSTKFEYVDLQLNGTWRPDKLRVIWLRSHRRAQTTEVTWVAKTDSGPNGAVGRAVFDPPITAALLVTLYRDGKKTAFDSKDYKYFIENEGSGGKKILASITVDLAEYAGMPSSRHPLELTCKSVSKKVNEAVIGATIESEFIKQGDSNDDDMQSTFSALSTGQESIMFDEEDDDDELDEAATMDHSHQSNGIATTKVATTTMKEDTSAPPPADSKPLGAQSSNSTINSSVSPMDLMLLQPSQTSSSSIESNGVPSSSLKQPDTAEPKKMSIINEKIEEEDEGTKSDAPPAKEQSPPVAGNSTDSVAEKPQEKDKPKNEKKEDKGTTQQQTQTHSKPQAQARTEPQPQSQTEPKTQPHTEPQTQAQTKKTQTKAQTQPQPQAQAQIQPQPQAPKQLTQQQAQPHYDFAYEMSMMLAGASSPKSNHSVQSQKSNNPFDESIEVEPPATVSVRDVWLPGLELVDLKEASVSIERIEKACVIGLYFSAEWCPPCRRFLPKLTKFYNIMKENSRSFEIIYVTNDNTPTEAFKYMQDQQMPWPALPHGHPLIEKLKEEYKIKSIPMLTIVASSNGEQLDDNGKKSVDGASSASSAMKLFSKWLDKAGITPEEEVEREKRGFIGTVKKAFHAHDHSRTKSVDTEEHREQVQASKPRKSKSSNNHDQCASLLLEKDEKIRDLNEKNTALEQTNKDLNEEAVELKKKIQDLENKMDVLQKSAHDLEAEKERVRAQTELTGWLCKRGVRGPTANVWRRRYFRLDQGSKLYYYKSSSEGTPQGFIDLVKVVDVSEVSAAQQDKNHATFHVLVEGRTFQLQAIDEPNMRKWMDAISYLKDYYQKRS